jgi:hypothetical protein
MISTLFESLPASGLAPAISKSVLGNSTARTDIAQNSKPLKVIADSFMVIPSGFVGAATSTRSGQASAAINTLHPTNHLRLMELLAIPLGNHKTVAKWLVIAIRLSWHASQVASSSNAA